MEGRWDPAQYCRFRAERGQAFLDLVARLPEGPVRRAADLGCGTGEHAQMLARRWPEATVWGVDSSEEMLARALAGELPDNLRFVHQDLRDWEPPGPLDRIVSNAVLHWLPDHATVLRRFVGWLAPGGVLAVQLPRRRGEVDAILDELLAAPPWAQLLSGVQRPHVESPSWYADELARLGLQVDLWETIYYHRFPGPESVIEWLKGTTLRPFLERLAGEQLDLFHAELGRRVAAAYRPGPHGVLYAFRRLFFLAERAGIAGSP